MDVLCQQWRRGWTGHRMVTQKGVKLRNTCRGGVGGSSTVAGEKIQQKNLTGQPNTARLLINNGPMIYRWFISKSNPFVICPRPWPPCILFLRDN